MTATETPNVSTETHVSTNETSASGRVKWFNNKAGYGFITVTTSDHAGEDVFVHHSAIQVEHEQYRYLVQGEYVNFSLCSVEDQQHKWQAGTVKGINNGKLMCETRLESRETRMTRTNDTDNDSTQRSHYHKDNRDTRDNRDESQNRIRSRGPGPREGDEWMLVRRRQPRHTSNQSTSNQSTSQEVLRSRPTRAYNVGNQS